MKSRAEINAFLKKEKKQFNFKFTFDLKRDLVYLDWIFNQFIKGEMTGLLEGKALLKAPDLEAADFLARQVRDEIKHARLYANLRSRLRKQNPDADFLKVPGFLSALVQPISGRLWYEHCFLDKNIGEDWVLCLMLTLMNTMPEKRLVNTLESIAVDEVTHIQFGRAQTQKALNKSNFYRNYLMGLYSRNRWAMQLFYGMVLKHFHRKQRDDLARLTEQFFTQTMSMLDQRTEELLGRKLPRGFAAFGRAVFSQAIFTLRFFLTGWFRRAPALERVTESA